MPTDARLRPIPREVLQARVRALTAGARTAPPECCLRATRAAAQDPTGFTAITLPTDAPDDLPDEPRRDAWVLSPLDPSLGFVPCSYGCVAAITARRASLAGRDPGPLRRVLATRVLALAPGIDVVVAGERGRAAGSVRPTAICPVVSRATPPVVARLFESLVVRRMIAGPELRFDGPCLDVKQGLVFVKMLHRSGARWLDLSAE